MNKSRMYRWFSLCLAVIVLVVSVPGPGVNASNSNVIYDDTENIIENETDLSIEDTSVSGNEISEEETDTTEAVSEERGQESSAEESSEEISSEEVVSGEETTTEEQNSEETTSEEETQDSVSENEVDVLEEKYQYLAFEEYGENIDFSIPEKEYVTSIEGVAKYVIYRVNTAALEEFIFEAAVRAGDKLDIPESLRNIIYEKNDRVFQDGRWVYTYVLDFSELETSDQEPVVIRLKMSHESVPVQIEGNANVKGIDENGYAVIGQEVSIEVTEPGYTLVKLTKDEKGNDVYTAMELDYDNCYVFTAEEEVQFFVVDPEKFDYTIKDSVTRKAKILGEKGLKLTGLASSAQGYDEIVLNFTAIKNGTDGTATENVYYEVKVTAIEKEGVTLPAGSSTTPKYYYILKTENSNTQSKSIKVNNGDLSAPTAATYEFAVRMVMISKNINVPDEDTALTNPLTANLTNNTLIKQFATKNLYYEDRLGFTKKNIKIYNGQKNVLAGIVKYSKNASYLHDLTAVAYDSRGAVCEEITCRFENDNDELYVSTESYIAPGKYKIVVYASVGEKAAKDNPQGGTMYQSNTSFTLTVQEGIYFIETDNIVDEVGVNSKNVNMSVVPVGRTYYTYKKAAKQKFTYELKSVVFSDDGSYTLTEPTGKVAQSVSLNSNGRLTINKTYYVDEDTSKNYVGIVYKAADYEGNVATATKLIEIKATVSVPTTIYLLDSNGRKLGNTIYPYQADGAEVIVLDQYGNKMNHKVTITPVDNSKQTAAAYVYHNTYSEKDFLKVRRCNTINIKAVTKDGTRKSKALRVKIVYGRTNGDGVYNLLSIDYKGIYIHDYTTAKGLVTYNAPVGSVIRFRLGSEHGDVTSYNRGWYKWKYKSTGGKLKFDGDTLILTPTSKTATVVFWDKERPYYTRTVKFVNNNWSTKYDNPPKVSLVSGKLYSNKYTNAADMERYKYEDGYEEVYPPDQVLTYKYEYGSYDNVQIGQINKNSPYLFIDDFDAEQRTFSLKLRPGDNIKTGNYKYAIAFYRDGVLMCKAATITVRVNAAPHPKVTAAYTLNTVNTDQVALKCTTKDFFPDFETKLLNANVFGKANDFNKYFELAYVTDTSTGKTVPVIRFKSTVTAEQKEKLKKQKLTGYVKYSYYYGYSHIENVTSKVTITIK